MDYDGVREFPRFKMFNDPVHGHIKIGGECLKVLDTPQFQRLRYIKQLAAVSYVYPGATHDRLSHSLGTCHLAQQTINHLKETQPELEIEPFEQEAVNLAALCHDIGHGPFSHALDNHIIPTLLGDSKWHHEERGSAIIDHLIDVNGLEIDKVIVDMAKDLILSKLPEERTSHYSRRFLWDIVANGRSSVDVDKFDYLKRDSHYCGVLTSFDHQRIVNQMRVVDGEICFNAKEAEAVYELFAMRSKMHRTVYQHRCVKAIEFMIVDSLKFADPVFGFGENLVPDNLEGFCQLDDSVLRTVLHTKDARLEKSQTIIKRLECRNLYKWVNEFVIPAKFLRKFKPVRTEEILAFSESSVKLKPEDVIVHNMKVDYGKDVENPVDYVRFFDKHRPDEKFSIEAEKISTMLPRDYKDVTVRIYSRTADKEKLEALRSATENFQEKVIGAIVQRTPQKRRRDDSCETSMSDTLGSIARNLANKYK